MKSTLLVRLVICLTVIVALVFGIAFAQRHKPVLLHILAETNCACGDYHEDVTGLVVFNPFRNHLPEERAANFLEELRNGKCTADVSLCQYALNGHRVSEWRLANLRDVNNHVLLYYKLTKMSGDEAKLRFSGEGLVEVARTQDGWDVVNYSSYF